MAKMTDSASELSAQMGERLKIIRQTRGLSQEKLGAAIGVTFQQIQKYERGTNRISLPAFVQICQVLNVHPMEVIGEFSDNEAEPNAILQRLTAAESKLARVQKILAERD
jgi:transcriptional regulator with XRE-family HTH domain